jgi:hypothetical protein
MTIPARTHHLAYALALGLPALALGLAALAQRSAGPACVELPDDLAQPGLTSLTEAVPHPACIRVKLAEAR